MTVYYTRNGIDYDAKFQGSVEKSTTHILVNADVDRIQNYAFKGFTALKSVGLPYNVESIGIGAFDGCVSLEVVSLPNTVKNIAEVAFHNCANLKEVVLGKELKTIGERAFQYCPLIETVYYRGTKEEFENIEIGKGNFDLLKAKIVFEYML